MRCMIGERNEGPRAGAMVSSDDRSHPLMLCLRLRYGTAA